MKKILIVTRSFYPNNWPRAFRATELAKEFARQGHIVTVITPIVSEHVAFEKKHNIIIKDLGVVRFKGLKIKGKGVQLIIRKSINKLSNWLFEFPNIQLIWNVTNSLKKEKGHDLILSIAHPYPIHWGVASIWNKNQSIAKYWIADCGDPYLNQDNGGWKPPFYFGFVEKWFMRKATFITVPIVEALSGYFEEFHDKIKIIPQGFRFEDIILSEGYPSEDRLTFGYAGMFIPGKRDPSEFLSFLNLLDDSFKFEFHIYTHNPGVVEPFIKESKGRILLLPVQPREKVLYELSKMNFVVNFENFGTKQSPSKLIDYGILKKPVLSIKFGDLKEEIVLEFLNKNYSNKLLLENIKKYRIENISQTFLKLIK